MVNLAVNARDAMPNGGVLTIATRRVQGDVVGSNGASVVANLCAELTLRDTGTGMTPEVRAHLFEPFFSTKGPGKGTGLGLATVYGIVKQNRGEIQAYSEVGKGSEFRIYLPCCHDGVPDTAPGPSLEQGLLRGTETILVVEDEDRVRRFACDALRRLGYAVLEACDGVAALEVITGAEAPPISLVVTDIVMPRMGGRDLAAHLRKVRPDVPVLFMTGYPGDGDQPGEAVYPSPVRKPFTVDVLARRVRQVLDGASP